MMPTPTPTPTRTLRRSARLSSSGAAITPSSTSSAALPSKSRPSKLPKKDTVSTSGSTIPRSPTPPDADSSCSLLLQLPTELLTAVIDCLNPRDAISLSFTCRDLYYGLLSDKNHFLWHRIGRFKYQLPGYSNKWYIYVQKRAEFERSKLTGKDTAAGNGHNESTGTDTNTATNLERQFNPHEAAGLFDQPSTAMVPMYTPVHHAIRIYESDFYVDYKGILLSAMRGEDENHDCCQWCLQYLHGWDHIVHLRRTTWNKDTMDWVIDNLNPTLYWRCCAQCRQDNSISVDETKKLGIDLEGVSLHDARTTGIRYYWKPTIQARVVKRYGQGANISFARAQWEKELVNLPAYRERHFTLIFASIKALYSAKSEKDSALWTLKKKIKPQHLQKEWFFALGPEEETDEAKVAWEIYCNHDPLMCLLRHPEIGDLWKDCEWVKTQAEYKLDFIVNLLTRWRTPQAYYAEDIPTIKLIRDVTNIGLEAALDTLQEAGVEDLRQRMTEANGHGFECPWTQETGACAKLRFSSTQAFLAHLVTHCWGILLRGDLNWLVGTPSTWWPEDLPIQAVRVTRIRRRMIASASDSVDNSTGTAATDANLKCGYPYTYVSLAEYEPHLAQGQWLQKWWPEKWKRSYKSKLSRWYAEGKFHDLDGMTRKDRDAIDMEDEFSDESD